MLDARTYRFADTLKNGASIVIRAISADDGERIRTAFGKLERETIYTRFFMYRDGLTEQELKTLTEIDFERTVGLLVTVMEDGAEVVIGGGRYMAYDGAEGVRVAEVAFTVEEDYQGQGLASRLLAHLAIIGRAKGIARFEAEVLPLNTAMLKVFERSGLPLSRRRGEGAVHVELGLDTA